MRTGGTCEVNVCCVCISARVLARARRGGGEKERARLLRSVLRMYIEITEKMGPDRLRILYSEERERSACV